MSISEADARNLKQAAVDALRRGDWANARAQFDRLVAAEQADGLVWLGLAAACRGLSDGAAMIVAVDKVLGLEPRNVRALIMKADHMVASGDVPGGLAFYRGAMKSATSAGRLPQDLINELNRAQAVCQRHAQDFEDYVRTKVQAAGFDERTWSGRFARSLDLMHGKRERFYQEPRHYYFPELPQIQFYDRALFPWLDAVEAATADIRREAEAVLADSAAFKPYVTAGANERPYGDGRGLRDNPDWSAFFMWRDGEEVPENAARCPKTLKALEHAPLSRTKGRMPSILFSLMRPGAHIPPHTGVTNARLICHLPLIVPEGCEFRVGNEVRPWVEGKAWVFDDSMNHEAWNRSDKTRVILLFDIWRPELSEDERQLISAMLQAIDAFGSGGTKWDA
jgi:aspartyl/asparaginyl beta-hydroxylase (cupin superfamily)